MSGTLNFVVVSLILRIPAALFRLSIPAFSSTMRNHLRLLHGCENSWIGLLVNCLMAMNSFLFLKPNALLDQGLDSYPRVLLQRKTTPPRPHLLPLSQCLLPLSQRLLPLSLRLLPLSLRLLSLSLRLLPLSLRLLPPSLRLLPPSQRPLPRNERKTGSALSSARSRLNYRGRARTGINESIQQRPVPSPVRTVSCYYFEICIIR
jgi:hypothetical protein